MLQIILRRIVKALLWFAAGSFLVVLVLRWIPPPGTALMVERKVESWFDGEPIDLQRDWEPWDKISDNLKIAVIAGEDQKFAEHWGFDVEAIQAAILHNELGGSIRGASTLSQQVSKNLFLWSGRSYLRKGLEAWFTMLIELLWSKERILEVYLNSVEWDERRVRRPGCCATPLPHQRQRPLRTTGQLPRRRPAQPTTVERQPPQQLRLPPRRLDSPADASAGRGRVFAGVEQQPSVVMGSQRGRRASGTACDAERRTIATNKNAPIISGRFSLSDSLTQQSTS